MSLRHAGPLTRLGTGLVWSALRRLSSHPAESKVLAVTGPAVLFFTLLAWALLFWAAWFLIFLSEPYSVIVSSTQAPADPWGKLYFAGFSITTLGIGDLVPGSAGWQVLTALAALTGLIVITSGITYLLSVINALVETRQFATYTSSLGARSEAVVAAGWNGRDFSMLLTHLETLGPALMLNVQQYSAYPILRHFYSGENHSAVPLAVAMLDEIVTLLEHGVSPAHRPDPFVLAPIRKALDLSLAGADSSGPEASPRTSCLALLRDAGIPTVSDGEFEAALEREAPRRRRRAAMLAEEGFDPS